MNRQVSNLLSQTITVPVWPEMALLFTFTMLILPVICLAQESPAAISQLWDPIPEIVAPGEQDQEPPSDAIILFDGRSLDAWSGDDGGPPGWQVENGIMTVVPGTGSIITRDSFGDCQLHIEWRTPSVVRGEGQDRGNSGVFLMRRYEVQILDSYNNRTYSNGQAGSIYKQHLPLVNASRPPGEWQTYDIIFTAPRFNQNGQLKSQATMTVLHNGVLIQNSAALIGTTENVGAPRISPHPGRQPLQLQDHNNPVSFRNIWIRPL